GIGKAHKMSEPAEAAPDPRMLMALLTEINHLLNSPAEAMDVYARVSEAIRERLEAFCVAVVYAKGATNLTARGLSAARCFRRSELSGLLKEDCDVGEIMRALRRTGLYAQKLRTERAWRLTAVPLVTQWSDRQGFLLALSAAAYHPIVHDTLRLV